MSSLDTTPEETWDEQTSQMFIDYGRYFIPEREKQLQTIVDLLPRCEQPNTIIDLCCGEGLLAQAILERMPTCTVIGLDGSSKMIQRARERLAGFAGRFQILQFDLFSRSWPDVDDPVVGLVSCLAIHHLNGAQKRVLFMEAQELLAPGGVFLIADLIEPAQPSGWEVAAKAWDEAVYRHAIELDGNTDGFASFEREHWNTFRYFDPQDIDRPSRLFDQLKWLEQAGFVDVDVYWMYAGHAIFGGCKSTAG